MTKNFWDRDRGMLAKKLQYGNLVVNFLAASNDSPEGRETNHNTACVCKVNVIANIKCAIREFLSGDRCTGTMS
ncbi:hypothetical protein N7488_004380 [Penicillium malachiteum]|nr:hypothetical protein N7488_004380 [Penicillium malachiteum]